MIRIGDLQAFVVIKQFQSKVWTGLIFCAEHLDLSKALKQAFDDVRLGASPDEADARSDLKEFNLPRHSLTKKNLNLWNPTFGDRFFKMVQTYDDTIHLQYLYPFTSCFV